MLENIKRVGDVVANCADELSVLSKREAVTVLDLLRAAVEASTEVDVPVAARPRPAPPARVPAAEVQNSPREVEEDEPSIDDDDDGDFDALDDDPEEQAGLRRRAEGRRGAKEVETAEAREDAGIRRDAVAGKALESKIRNCLLQVRQLGDAATTANLMAGWKLLSGQGVRLRMHQAVSRKLVEPPGVGGKVARPWRLTGLGVEWLEKHGGLPE